MSAQVSAQKTTLDTTLVLESLTQTWSVPVQINAGARDLSFGVEGEISTGSISLKIYDPNGKKQSGLQLKTSDGAVETGQSKAKARAKGGSGSSVTVETDSDGNTSTISISSGAGGTVVQSSGKNSNENKNKNRNSSSSDGTTNEVTVTTGDGSAKVGTGTTDHGRYMYTSSYSSKGAKGVLHETIDRPTAGKWRVEIIAENVSGEVKLVVNQK